ncbi:MAG: class I SAM-dependent methyltransferase [Anaerolineae bacterium]
MSRVPLYDQLSEIYDRFVDWPARLAFELPFLEKLLREAGARRVLDAACGTGQHAIALAKAGFDVVGADLSQPMVEAAQWKAKDAGVEVEFVTAGFGELVDKAAGPFDALLCLGNSIPHVSDLAHLTAALRDFRAVLRPGGLLLLQQRNFDKVLRRRERFLPPQVNTGGEDEWLFFRYYDFLEDGRLRFNMVMVHRAPAGETCRMESTLLFPLTSGQLLSACAGAGFTDLTLYGSMQGEPFDPEHSSDLVLVGRAGG